MTTVAIIPARFASTRLPGKPLLDQTGRPLVCHVVDQVSRAQSIDRVIVATDDHRILETVNRHGGRAVMTRDDHPNGTTRIAEVAADLPDSVDLVVNVQGDEPMIPPDLVDAAVERIRQGDEQMSTIASPFADHEDPANPNVVKVAVDQRGRAMYFSRSVIPYDRDGDRPADKPLLKHIGLYVYRRDFLNTYVTLPPTPAEQSEKLEQLRALEHGYVIGVAIRRVDHQGIDTPEQYAQFVKQWRKTHGG